MIGLSPDLFRPKTNSVRNPSFGVGTGAKPEAMTNAGILVILHASPRSPQRRNPFFHDTGRCDSIGITNGDERGRFRRSEIRVAGVQGEGRREDGPRDPVKESAPTGPVWLPSELKNWWS